jgi:ATP-binding cassette subfamily B protein
MAFYDSWKYLNEGFFGVAVLSLSLLLFTTRSITAGDVLKFSMLFASILVPLRDLHRILDEAHESSIQVRDYFGLLDKPLDPSYIAAEIAPPSSEARSSAAIIEFSGASFSYPEKKNVFDKINFVIHQGEVVAFAGSSGSGKSTLLGVLLRLRHLYQGTVYLKGRDIATFSREEIAEIFGYVSQDPFLFAGTVAENIAYGSRGNPSDKDIIAAAKKASIHGEILRMLDGYDSLVHENGRNLSGGQRQRIAIARVFLLNPEILLLDEATAGLDMSNELRVQKALEHAMSGRTVISTSHRLSTLKKADRVLFLEDGRITADGTYEDLLAESQRFSSLVCAEFQDIQQDRLGDPRRHSILEQKIPVLLTR